MPDTLGWVIMGLPGAGKETQSEILVRRFGLTHVSTGNLLREEMDARTPLGLAMTERMNAGFLATPEQVYAVLEHRFAGLQRWILDGFPRIVEQADWLDRTAPPQRIIFLDIDVETARRRCTGRLTCKRQHVYHIEYAPPRHAGICDYDGLALQARPEDSKESLQRRFDTFQRETMPVVEHYRQHQGFFSVDANQPAAKVAAAILTELERR